MVDVFNKRKRSQVMRAIRCADTAPEMRLRSALHRLGYRYKLHDSRLPGKPDLVFPSRRKVIFVHGCFWHRHRCSRGQSMPQTRQAFWKRKFESNIARDRKVRIRLRRLKWQSRVVWECELTATRFDSLLMRLVRFLDAEDDARLTMAKGQNANRRKRECLCHSGFPLFVLAFVWQRRRQGR